MKIHSIDKQYLGKPRSSSNQFFHYTSPAAALEIIKNRSIRFTNCSFLNDKEEYVYIYSLLDDYASKSINKEITNFIRTMRSYITDENKGYCSLMGFRKLKEIEGQYYVLSGSINKDSLSMWKYYSKEGNYDGYAMQFDVSGIIKAIEKQEGDLIYGRVLYDKDEQFKTIENYTETLFSKFEDDREKYGDHIATDNLQGDFLDFIQHIRLFYKSPLYKEEKEYRVVILVNNNRICDENKDKDSEISYNFSIIRGVFRPHIEIKFKNGIPLKSITLSPTIEKEIGKRGLGAVLSQYGLDALVKDDKIEESRLKLRY